MKTSSLPTHYFTLETSTFARRIILASLSAYFGIALARPCSADSFTFAPTASLLHARYGHTATLLKNGKVLVAAGFFDAETTAELYDPSSGTWESTGSLSNGRVNHTATLLRSGKVLVAGGGGIGTRGHAAETETYDPATGIWTKSGPLITNRNYHTATLLKNGKVLVAAGNTGPFDGKYIPTSSAELYDSSSRMWTATGSLLTARYWTTATLLTDGRVLVAGGTTDSTSGSDLASAELYDPATGTWTSTGSMSVARSLHTATLLHNGQVLVAGGLSNYVYLQSAELYDPTTGTWTVTGTLNTPRYDAQALRLADGNVLLVGGGFPFYTATDLYNPATGKWTPAGNLAISNVGSPATLLRNGDVLLEGGLDASGQETATAQIGSAASIK